MPLPWRVKGPSSLDAVMRQPYGYTRAGAVSESGSTHRPTAGDAPSLAGPRKQTVSGAKGKKHSSKKKSGKASGGSSSGAKRGGKRVSFTTKDGRKVSFPVRKKKK